MKTPPFPPGALLIAYLRDSGHETQELSIEQQETELLHWAARHGYTITKIYKDTASGTSTAGRENFHAMMSYMRSAQRKESGLVVWKWNRFARNIDDAQFYRADLRRRGITLYSLNDDIPQGPEGRFFEAAIDWMNQAYIEDLRADTRRGLRNLVERYGCVPGTPPRGFKRQPVTISTRRDGQPHIAHKWVPDPELIPLVKRAWQMRAAGASYPQITAAVPLYKARNAWNTFFRNKLYIGVLEFGGLTIKNYCEPIIDRQIWEAVQKINRKNEERRKKRNPAPHRRRGSRYLLSGLVRCARCGGAMNGRTNHAKGHKYHYYECSRRRRSGDCEALAIPQTVLENAVKEQLIQYLGQPEAIAAIQKKQQQNSASVHQEARTRQNVLKRKLRSLNRQIANTTAAIAAIGHSTALLEKLTELETEKALTQNELQRLKTQLISSPWLTLAQITDLGNSLAAAINKATPEQLKQIYLGLIETITVERSGDTLTGLIRFYLPPKQTSPSPEGDVCTYDQCPGRESNPQPRL